MKKVVILSPTNKSVGGVERFSVYLTRALVSCNVLVEVVSSENLSRWQRLLFKACSFVGLGPPVLGYFLGSIAKRERFDVCVTNGLLGWNLRKAKLLNVQHGTFAASADRIDQGRNIFKWFMKRRIWAYFEMLAARHATIVVAVSKETADNVKKYYHISNIELINNSVDTEFFVKKDKLESRNALGLETDKTILLFVGRYEFAKGKSILDAMKKDLESLNASMIISESFSQEELVYLYNAADIFIFPSLHEGCSYALLEAMACGKMFLASSVGIVPDLASEGLFLDCIVQDQNSKEYIAKLKNFLALSDEEKDSLSLKISNYTKEHYNLKIFEERYMDLFNKLTKN